VPNSLFLFTAQLIAILAVILLAVGFLKADRKAEHKTKSSRVFAILAVFVMCYLITGMSAPHIADSFRLVLGPLEPMFNIFTTAIPGMFMVYCFLVFQEQSKFPMLLVVLFATQMLLESFIILFDPLSSVDGSLLMLTNLLITGLDVLQLSFAGFAVYWTLEGWSSDLVEDRRALRWLVIGVQGGLIFVVVLVENFLLPTGSMNDAQAQVVIVSAIAILAMGMLIVTMQFDYVSLSNVIRIVAELREESPPENHFKFDKASFNKSFTEGKLHREAGLTIASLAKKLKVPEYRLRAFIHNTLGFRNFNAMLHKYRIADACDALADTEKQNVPVLTIALKVGYQSITPFNNAFREIVGVTPSEYRKKKIRAG
jgi:AraC-like DNA-binding protein